MARISIVVIARNEEQQLAQLLPDLSRLDNVEVIVADGQSTDRTQQVALQHGCRYLVTPPGRARQLNAGAHLAAGEVLLFLHADCRLQEGWNRELLRALDDSTVVGGAFSLKMSGGCPWLDRFLSWSGRHNARRSRTFLGDHSIFVRREVFDKVRGFPEVELMEDYLFSKRLHAIGRLVQLKSLSHASARRFMENGYLKTILQMRLLRLLAALGYSNHRLCQQYLGSGKKPSSTD
ncbi:MAG: TIGR04283 family arsenosugar biosynthesis glycosyltransferase [Acidobacteria bacterium]|nr:TIGR04283 family arsenosugar biosynthesis glycosyltransferase [Acidobacteriota bacterium]